MENSINVPRIPIVEAELLKLSLSELQIQLISYILLNKENVTRYHLMNLTHGRSSTVHENLIKLENYRIIKSAPKIVDAKGRPAYIFSPLIFDEFIHYMREFLVSNKMVFVYFREIFGSDKNLLLFLKATFKLERDMFAFLRDVFDSAAELVEYIKKNE